MKLPKKVQEGTSRAKTKKTLGRNERTKRQKRTPGFRKRWTAEKKNAIQAKFQDVVSGDQ